MSNAAYVKMVQAEMPNAPMSEKMVAVNQLAKANGAALSPFAPIDIAEIRWMEFVGENTSPREQDLIIASTLLRPVYSVMHTTVQALREEMSPQDVKDCVLLKGSLQRLDVECLITDGLDSSSLKIWEDLA